jgi:hypothetical protein
MILDFTELADLIATRLRGSFAPDEVLDTRGAAALLLVSERTVLIWAGRGVIPGKKLDGLWRFRRSALLDFITDSSHTAAESLALASD